MEPSSLTLITQFSRRSVLEGIHTAYLASSRKEISNVASADSTSDLDHFVDHFQTINPFESVGHRPADGTSVMDNLCASCEAIDIPSHLRRQEPREPGLALSLGTLLEVVTKADCAFCKFVTTMIRAQYASLIDESFWRHCSIYGGPVNCVLEELCIPSNTGTASESKLRFAFYIKLDPHPYLSSAHHDHTKLLNATFHTLADPVQTNYNVHQARKIATQLEPNLLRRWLTTCETRHPYHPYHIPGLRLIDLLENRLVLPDATVRYVALSYVWGTTPTLTLRKANSGELHAVGGLRRHATLLSRTVRDAMRLSKILRERFLWVDALCITQDDSSDQRAQIMKMDQVYQNAVLTLVACAGSSADSGLPGLHPYTRIPVQVAASIRGQALISHDVEKWWKEVRTSVWHTRGWTYQEKLCSNRLLVIGKSQAHFTCTGNCVFCEEIAAEIDLDTPSPEPPSPLTTNYFPRTIWTTLVDSFQAYKNIITESSKRALSNTHDALNAVSGILNRWRHHYGHWGFISGLPAGMMDAALLWQARGAHRRRRDPRTGHTIAYRSWSWAAWEGEFDFPNVRNPHDTLRSMIRWESPERHEENLASWRKILGPEDPRMADGPAQNWERTVTIGGSNDVVNIYYVDKALPAGQAHFAYPSRRNAEGVTICGATELHGTLRFRAKCGVFSLVKRNLAFSSPMTAILHNSSSLTILDKDGCAAGAVQVPPAWVDAMTKTPQEFVALSRTTLTQDADDPSWDETTQSFLLEKPTDRSQVLREGSAAKRLRDHLNGHEEPESYAGAWRLFDRQKYSAFKFWPMYNVLLLGRNGGYAYRLGLGQVHVDAFDSVAKEKLVLLI
jgi:hypothetical protein